MTLTKTSLILVFLVPLIAVSFHFYYLFANVEAPPPDFGSGSMFDKISHRYDMINRVLAVGMDVGWRQRMVQVVKESVKDLQEPHLLDIATGTADVALLLAKEIPSARVLGVDPSNNMLDVGRTKTRNQGLDGRINLQVADAQEFAGIESQSFDAATMAFGIRNVPDRNKALCQIHRVLKTGSRFCILEFSEPDDSFGTLGTVARFFIRHVVPFLGGILSGAPREYLHLQNSIKDFPSPNQFREIIDSVECPDGSFEFLELMHMNFGSVQLYVSKVLREEEASAT